MSDVNLTALAADEIQLTVEESDVLALELNVGPAGPAGATGPTGPQGPAGPLPTGSSNAVAVYDSNGDLGEVSGASIDSTAAMALNQTYAPANAGGRGIHQLGTNFAPTAPAPDDYFSLLSLSANFDTLGGGNAQGTNGNALTLINNNISHQGSGDIGALIFTNNYFSLGNGTDPIDVNGFSYAFGFGNVNAGANMAGPMQGYGFQPNIHASATTGAGCYVNAFYDYSQIGCTIGSYSSFAAGPIIAEIKTNNGYTALNVNPQVTNFAGNAGFTGVGIFPTLGTFGTGSFQGVQVAPTIPSMGANYAVGIRIDMSGVVGSNVHALSVKGDVDIDGALSFTGALSIGQLQAFYTASPVDGGGNPQGLHGLITQMIAPANTTTANCDAIGVNTAMLVTLQANSINTSSAIGLGFSALALPCVVETHTGSSLDYMSGAVFALNCVGTSTGGTIQNANVCRSVIIPNGITTIDNVRGFYYHEPFGQPGTLTWGLYAEHGDNFVKSMKVGGTPGSTDRVTNSSVGLELESGALLVARMDSTAEAALTAIDGMIIYNTTTGKFRGRAGGVWADLN